MNYSRAFLLILIIITVRWPKTLRYRQTNWQFEGLGTHTYQIVFEDVKSHCIRKTGIIFAKFMLDKIIHIVVSVLTFHTVLLRELSNRLDKFSEN
jgi:hypothetical protein